MFPHVVDAGELVGGKRLSGGCSALMTFARKTGAALVVNVFTLVLQLTGYKEDLDVQPISAQNGIKYVMAITCIVFMVLGFIMSKKYVLSREKNKQVQKYLSLKREGRLGELTAEQSEELEALVRSIS